MILVPLDGSPLAERAIPFAAALASPAHAALVLLRAVAAPGPALEDAKRYLDEVRYSIGPRLAVETASSVGPAGAVIVHEAGGRHAELIVMVSHGRTGPGRALLGSVADHVLRRAPVPVLVVPSACNRAWASDRPLRIVVPLDGSDFGERALGPVRDLARTLQAGSGTEVVLLRVIDLSAEIYYRRASRELFFDLDIALKAARAYLRSCTHALSDVTPRVGIRALAGSPGATIARAALDLGADLIAMATHGHGGVSRVLAGSVATETLRHARVPVLLVRPEALRGAAPQARAPQVSVFPDASISGRRMTRQ